MSNAVKITEMVLFCHWQMMCWQEKNYTDIQQTATTHKYHIPSHINYGNKCCVSYMKENFESTSSITTAYWSKHEDIPTSDIKEI